jgi:hypothetical protein
MFLYMSIYNTEFDGNVVRLHYIVGMIMLDGLRSGQLFIVN